jgi:hypothetical protein
MRFLEGMRPRQARPVVWLATGIASVFVALLLVTGLLVPGFLLDESESSALPEALSTDDSDRPAKEPPWAAVHLSHLNLTPDVAVARLATRFVSHLNAGQAAGAVEMLCPDKRRLIRNAVVWTANHVGTLRITTPLADAARPGYVTIHFVGVIEGRQRRGTAGIDADAQGHPRCVSAFYSVG